MWCRSGGRAGGGRGAGQVFDLPSMRVQVTEQLEDRHQASIPSLGVKVGSDGWWDGVCSGEGHMAKLHCAVITTTDGGGCPGWSQSAASSAERRVQHDTCCRGSGDICRGLLMRPGLFPSLHHAGTLQGQGALTGTPGHRRAPCAGLPQMVQQDPGRTAM